MEYKNISNKNLNLIKKVERDSKDWLSYIHFFYVNTMNKYRTLRMCNLGKGEELEQADGLRKGFVYQGSGHTTIYCATP